MKKIAVFLAFLISLGLFSACGGASLPEGFDEAGVLSAAEKAVETLNAGDYEGFAALCAEDMRSSMTPDVLEGAVAQVMPEAGAFKSFSSTAVTGQKAADGTEYAAAVLIAAYENQSVTYTVSLDKDLLLIGFYLK